MGKEANRSLFPSRRWRPEFRFPSGSYDKFPVSTDHCQAQAPNARIIAKPWIGNTASFGIHLYGIPIVDGFEYPVGMSALFLNCCPQNRNGFCPLRIELDRPYRIGREDEEYVVVFAAEGQIRSLFWQQNFPDQFPLRIQYVDAIHGPHVDIAFFVQTHPVRKPRGDHSQPSLVA